MAESELTVHSIDRTGTVADSASLFVAANADGNYWANDGGNFLVVKNASMSGVDVTFKFSPTAKIDGIAPTARTLTVAAGKIAFFGPFPEGDYNDTNNDTMHITYSAVTTVTVGVFDLGG